MAATRKPLGFGPSALHVKISGGWASALENQQPFITPITLHVLAVQQTPPTHELTPPQLTPHCWPLQLTLPPHDERPVH
jgi:hypothetical protein